MAQEIINIGSTANDGTGDPLRTALIKINNNFSKLFNANGWGYYSDSVLTNLTISTTLTQLTINSLGSNTNTDYLPKEIRGVSDLWTANKITLPNIGDAFDIRLDLEIISKTGSPTRLDLYLDIGSGTPIYVVSRLIGLSKIPPYKVSLGFPGFSLATFNANGGRLMLQTDTGSLDLGIRGIMMKRDFSEL